MALVCVAVPLKHLAGYATAVSVMGPIHGAAFLLYVWMVFYVVSSEDWSPGEITRLAVAALLPFGALLSAGLLRSKAGRLAAVTPAGTGALRT